MKDSQTSPLETAVLGGGCFWCIEAIFEQQAGVKSVTSGYAGGEGDSPDYQAVCRGDTGHAEVVKIEFDPIETHFEQILDVFWRVHDPTSLNRQGGDVGTQYRSVIFYNSEEQRIVAEQSRDAFDETLEGAVVTEISRLGKFFSAELYHQDYYKLNRDQNYCALVIKPKLKKLGLES